MRSTYRKALLASVTFILLATVAMAQSVLVKEWNFNTAGDVEGWTGANMTPAQGTSLGGTEGIVKSDAPIPTNDPMLTYTVGLPLGAQYSGWDRVEFRVRQINAAGTAAEPFVAGGTIVFLMPGAINRGGFPGANFTTTNEANEWIVASTSIAAMGTNEITQLRIDPIGGTAGIGKNFEVDYVRIYAIAAGTPTPTPTPGPGGITPLSNWPFQAVQIPTGGTVPTIDGVINPAEYEVTVPHYVALSSLKAADLYFPSKVHTGGTILNAANGVDNDADLSFNAYFVWDATALYVGVQGVDDQSQPAAAGAGPNSGDTFQLDISWDGGQTNAEIPTWAIVTNTNDSTNVRFKTFFTTNPFPGTTWAATVNGVNWTLESRIPWTALTNNGAITYTKPIPPAPGQSAQAMPMFGDRDNDASAFLLTAGNGANWIAASNAPNWNELFFLTEAIRPPNATQDWSMFQ